MSYCKYIYLQETLCSIYLFINFSNSVVPCLYPACYYWYFIFIILYHVECVSVSLLPLFILFFPVPTSENLLLPLLFFRSFILTAFFPAPSNKISDKIQSIFLFWFCCDPCIINLLCHSLLLSCLPCTLEFLCFFHFLEPAEKQ